MSAIDQILTDPNVQTAFDALRIGGDKQAEYAKRIIIAAVMTLRESKTETVG